MTKQYPKLDFAPGWAETQANLVQLVGLFGEHLDWRPRESEWNARQIFEHLILARYHGPIVTPADRRDLPVVASGCHSAEGIASGLRKSWEMLERFLLDEEGLNSLYDDGSQRPGLSGAPPLLGSVERAAAGFEIGYEDRPGRYTGHYIAYHRFAHDLHHRASLIGYLGMLGVSLDGHRIRPL